MGVGVGLYIYDVVVKKFTVAVWSPGVFLLLLPLDACATHICTARCVLWPGVRLSVCHKLVFRQNGWTNELASGTYAFIGVSNIATFTKEVMYSSLFVCLFVCTTLCKNFRTDLHEIFRKGCQWTNEQTIKLWWNPDPYRDTDKTCLSGDMHYCSASSFIMEFMYLQKYLIFPLEPCPKLRT